MTVEYPSSVDNEMPQSLAGLSASPEAPQHLAGTSPISLSTQDYVKAYNEALDGYRRRFVVLEQYSALLNR
jgi:hypothetical protein